MKYILFLLLTLCGTMVFGQSPVTLPLDHNPVLLNRKTITLKSDVQVDTISLPFIDDFSYYARSSQPNRKLWMDLYVFINNNYPIQPRSNGVATFDALDADGNVYKNTSATFPADTLTSCPIDLGESNVHNVYMSFFYQPQGYGDAPDPGDSLTVQFKSSIAGKWRTVWSTPGTTVHPFKQVLLPVDGEYLYKGFQFRFVNYVSLEQDRFNTGKKGNVDHWHVDYVRLDKSRHENDTAMYDVAMIAPMKSLIKGYHSIPWNQFELFFIAGRLKDSVGMTYRNNHNRGHRVSRYFAITDVYKNITYPFSPGGDENIGTGEIMTFRQPVNISDPFESASVDSVLFELKGYLETDFDDRKENDTVRYYQFFKNYFARDDGIPESGYGYIGYNAQGCAIACRYETLMPDTLQAIKIYFNPTFDDVTTKYRFKIAVWRDNSGVPGERIYLSSKEYSPKTTGQFTRFILDKPVYVTNRSNYWIGWVQVTTGFLNVGFDRNYNDKGNLWYNNGTWRQDINDGTLMIRPVFGKRKDFPTPAKEPAMTANTRLKIYPNPASQHIRIELETEAAIAFWDYDVEIYGITGQLHYRAPYSGNDIDVSGFEPGFYLVRMIHRKSGKTHVQKVVVER